MSRELILYCDESVQKGVYYSNFYGGLLVPAEHLPGVRQRVETLRDGLGIRAEIKWGSITPSVSDRYCELMSALFEEVSAGRVKIRIMFTQNRDLPVLTPEQRATSYHRLYYQFIKHAFGLEFAGSAGRDTRVRVLLDRMPTTAEQTAAFRAYLAALSKQPGFRRAGIHIPSDHIAEIDSRRHILAQCLDVVLGSMAFRLNDRHKAKPEGASRRGRRTREKDRVYKHINALIRGLYPGFNVGVSTARPNGRTDHWAHPYRHWLFVPRESVRDDSRTKKRKAP